ncbi:hypothetical protein LINGRAHAP2_LOCUS10232 [Linum grandiflorum]
MTGEGGEDPTEILVSLPVLAAEGPDLFHLTGFHSIHGRNKIINSNKQLVLVVRLQLARVLRGSGD